jgi:hypothetical protein
LIKFKWTFSSTVFTCILVIQFKSLCKRTWRKGGTYHDTMQKYWYIMIRFLCIDKAGVNPNVLFSFYLDQYAGVSQASYIINTIMAPPIFQHFYALQEKQLEKLNCNVNTAIVLFLDVMEPAPISIPIWMYFHCWQNLYARALPLILCQIWGDDAPSMQCSLAVKLIDDES